MGITDHAVRAVIEKDHQLTSKALRAATRSSEDPIFSHFQNSEWLKVPSLFTSRASKNPPQFLSSMRFLTSASLAIFYFFKFNFLIMYQIGWNGRIYSLKDPLPRLFYSLIFDYNRLIQEMMDIQNTRYAFCMLHNDYEHSWVSTYPVLLPLFYPFQNNGNNVKKDSIFELKMDRIKGTTPIIWYSGGILK